jgi:hypothetical protein
LNATGANLNQTTANTFTVSPVRNDTSNIAEVMFYNATSKEVTYGNTISVAGNISGSNFIGTLANGNSNVSIATANGNVTIAAVGNTTMTVTGTGANITGYANVTGNVTGGNISTAGIVKTGVFVTGTIPAAATAGAGAKVFVTDATASTFGTAYVGGAANAVPVWSDGTAWYIG